MRLYANLDLDIDTTFRPEVATHVIYAHTARPVQGAVTVDVDGGGCVLIKGTPADLCRLAAALAEAAEKAKAANARVAAVTPTDGAA